MRRIVNLLRRLAQGVLLGLLGIVGGLFIIEIALRVFFARQLEVDVKYVVVDPYVGWRHQPNWRGYYYGEGNKVPIAINSQGLRRSQTVNPEKPPNTTRVLIVGDSMTAGFEVTEDKTFCALLEKKLNQKGGQQYEVLNAGVWGWSADQCQIWLSREGVKYHPDIVLYVFCPNDVRDIMHTKHKPYYTLKGDQLELHLPAPTALRRAQYWLKNSYVRRLIRRLQNVRHQNNVITGRMDTVEERLDNMTRFQKTGDAGMNSPPWRLMQSIIKRMNDTCRQIGAKFYVTSSVVNFEMDDDILRQMGSRHPRSGDDPFRFEEHLMTLCKAEEIPYIKTHSIFRKHYRARGEDLWWQIDSHYNEKGHALMAQILYDALKESRSQ